MSNLQEFSRSANGARWYLAADVVEPYVLHQANLPSGGHQTLTPLNEFIELHPHTPELEALLALVQQQNPLGEEAHHVDLDTDG